MTAVDQGDYAEIYRSPDGVGAVLDAYRRLLEDWPVELRRLRLPTREGDTAVLDCGPVDAPPVLALHGSMANSAAWLPHLAGLTGQVRLLAVDLVGEPGLSAPTRPALDSDAPAGWLDDVLDGLRLDVTPLLGMSLGGWLALDFATRRPERVSRLALLSPSGVGRRKVGVLAKAVLLRPLGDKGRRRLLREVVGPTRFDGQPWSAPFAELAMLTAEHFRPRTEPIPIFSDDRLARLRMPVLAVLGGRDVLLDSGQTGSRLRASVPHAEVLTLPEVGHVLPDQSGPLLRFLSGPETRGRHAR
ncbi:MAG TPA: alpha/beta fold hydrolase [Pseudonocardia sp.]|jgi:pimeloyl-ACP methyl ester carboxylesterase